MLREVLLVLSVAREDRLYLTRRYERFFGGVAYLIWPRTELRLDACERRGVACLEVTSPSRTLAYATLFRDLARAGERAEWLRGGWRGGPMSGAIVAHMDFWIQPAAFAKRLHRRALDASNFWTLAAGLNAPPEGPPPLPQHLRVYGKGCLSGSDLRDEHDWTWGHGVRDAAIRRARAAGARLFDRTDDVDPVVCATHSDFFHVPSRAFSLFGRACEIFRDVSHEVAVPTVSRAVATRLRLGRNVLDCWGCSQSWANDPSIIARHACGHKLNLRLQHVRDFWHTLLDAPDPDGRRRPTDDALEAAIATLDAEQTAYDGVDPYWRNLSTVDLKPCCRDRTHGCCRVDGALQTACACVARDPARPPAANTSQCDDPGLVSSLVQRRHKPKKARTRPSSDDRP